jgi:N-acetylglucosaminyl-diphospho-decaprenol L-rhamnosyltransferase
MTTASCDMSIVVVSYNTSQLLDECLSSIYAEPRRITFEVIVVDNASSDGSPEMVESKWPQVVLMRNQANQGFAKANNQALEICRGRQAFLLNSDTQVRGDALETLSAYLDSNSKVGIVGPQLLNTDGSLQPSGNRIPTLWSHIWWSLPFYRIFGSSFWRNRYLERGRDYNQVAEVDEVSGAALLVRREVMEAIGLLDEEYFFYFEDVDFCIRAKKAGWRVMYVPQAKILHHWGKSPKKAGTSFQPRTLKGHFRYVRKVHGPFAEIVMRAVMALKAGSKIILLAPWLGGGSEERKQAARTNIEILRLSMNLKRTG